MSATDSGREGEDGVRLSAEQRLNRLLTLILEVAATVVGFDGATATVRHGDDQGTVAATHAGLVALDAAQYAADEGPCLEALEQNEAVTWTAADDEARWRAFQEAAAALGIATSLSVPLPIDETTEIAGSLNLYASEREQITSEQLEQAIGFALQLATALQAMDAARSTADIARRAAQTIRSQAAIEQAKGILASQHGVTPAAASSLLAEMAEQERATLRDIALRIVADATRGERPPTG